MSVERLGRRIQKAISQYPYSMLQSQLFSKTSRNLPEKEEAKNAQFLIKAGFINKSSAGVYAMLPLGFRILNKINQVIREEMNAIGAEELLMPALIQRKYWEQSNRWMTDIIYKTSAKGQAQNKDFDYGLGWTHEEVIAAIAVNFLQSYKDLPKAVYQIQMKFRAEPRVQAGLLRGREFLMKDLYSFHTDKENLDRYYQTVIGAYKKILNRLNLKFRLTEASGGAFTEEYTHEFQVLNPAGEDTVFYCKKCDWAQNKEIAKVNQGGSCPKCQGATEMEKGIEVANVFKLGVKFAKDFSLYYLDQKGERKPVVMGSYGIGPTRLMGTVVEVYNDEKGILWPESIAPFKIHLLTLGESKSAKFQADKLYKVLSGQMGESEVLYDQRNVSAGEKLNDADLLGVSWRAVISEKTIAAKKIELKKRSEKNVKLVSQGQLLKLTQ